MSKVNSKFPSIADHHIFEKVSFSEIQPLTWSPVLELQTPAPAIHMVSGVGSLALTLAWQVLHPPAPTMPPQPLSFSSFEQAVTSGKLWGFKRKARCCHCPF